MAWIKTHYFEPDTAYINPTKIISFRTKTAEQITSVYAHTSERDYLLGVFKNASKARQELDEFVRILGRDLKNIFQMESDLIDPDEYKKTQTPELTDTLQKGQT